METSGHIRHAPVLAAFSPEAGAREPVEFAVAASRITGAPLIIAVVVDTGSPVRLGSTVSADGPSLPAGVAAPVRHLQSELEGRGVPVEVRVFEDSTAARGLARAIDELEPELVVVGATSRGERGALLLGTTAGRVIRVSACPVAVVPRGYTRPENGVQVVCAAYTRTPEGEDALRAAASLARSGRVALRVIHVVEPKHMQEEAHRLMAEQHHAVGAESQYAARTRLDIEAQTRAAVAEAAGDLDADVDLMIDEPVRALAAASAHVDLLVMGSRGLGPRRSVVLGSVSRRVIERAACPVIVIPRDTEAKSEELLSDVEAHAPR